MAKQGRCFVEIFYLEDNIITFDFGHLAVVIERDPDDNSNNLIVYSGGKNYRQDFMGGVCKVIEEKELSTEIISIRKFREIENTLVLIGLGTEERLQIEKLCGLLNEYFPEYTQYLWI